MQCTVDGAWKTDFPERGKPQPASEWGEFLGLAGDETNVSK